MSHKANFFAAAFLVLLADGKILLSERKNTGWKDGYFSMITGHFEDNELGMDCISREAWEEAGITLNKIDLQFVHCQERIAPQTDGSIKAYFDFYYLADKWQGKLVNKEEDKCAQLKWFPITELPKNLVPGMKIAITSIIDNTKYSEFVDKL